MAQEIERKFLVNGKSWRDQVQVQYKITQGYLANTERGSFRIRISEQSATLNIKSMTCGVTRTEFEYPIPLDDAREMLQDLCIQPVIDKIRYHVPMQELVWDIDVFEGLNRGLIIAEIELPSTDSTYPEPPWLGAEVSHDPRYYNINLVEHPYCNW